MNHGLSPAETLLGRKLRTRLHKLVVNPNGNTDLGVHKEHCKCKQKIYHDSSSSVLELLKPSDAVCIHDSSCQAQRPVVIHGHPTIR